MQNEFWDGLKRTQNSVHASLKRCLTYLGRLFKGGGKREKGKETLLRGNCFSAQ